MNERLTVVGLNHAVDTCALGILRGEREYHELDDMASAVVADLPDEDVEFLLDWFDVEREDWLGDEPLADVTPRMFLTAKVEELITYTVFPPFA